MNQKVTRTQLLLGLLCVLGIVLVFYWMFQNSSIRKVLSKVSIGEPRYLYTACGCGCCGGSKPIKKCLYHSKGDDINKIIQNDNKSRMGKSCSLVGCSQPVGYVFCD